MVAAAIAERLVPFVCDGTQQFLCDGTLGRFCFYAMEPSSFHHYADGLTPAQLQLVPGLDTQPTPPGSESDAEVVEEVHAASAGRGNKKPVTKHRLNIPGRLEAILHYVRLSAFLPTPVMFYIFFILMLSRIKLIWKALRFADYCKTD